MMNEKTHSDPLMSRAARHREEQRAVSEGGGGVSEGFELSEQELIDHASHSDQHTPALIMRDATGYEKEPSGPVYGEADSEHHSD